MKIIIDWGRCEGNGACVVAAPELFDIDDKDMLVVLDETPSEERRAALKRAIDSCPRRAISMEG
jgi:ferredoxin